MKLNESILKNLNEDLFEESTVDSLCYRVMSLIQPSIENLPHILDNNIEGYPKNIKEIKNTINDIDKVLNGLNTLKRGLLEFVSQDSHNKYVKKTNQKRVNAGKYYLTPNKIKSLANKTRDLMNGIIEKEKQSYNRELDSWDEHDILENAILKAGDFLNKELYLPGGFLDLKYALALAFWNNAEDAVLKDLQEGNYDKIEQDWDFWKEE